MKAAVGQKDSSGIRNVFPGAEINTLYKPIGPNVGIYEEDASIYNLKEQTEEDKLFKINKSIRDILESLEKNTVTEQKNEKKTQ